MVILTWMSDVDPKELQGPAILSDLKERASKFADPFKKILLSIPEDTVCWHNRLSSWPSEPWDNRNGTVTLAGDAAHPMTFRAYPFIPFHLNTPLFFYRSLPSHFTPRRHLTQNSFPSTDRGQGLNNAIDDAAQLVQQLQSLSLTPSTDLKQPSSPPTFPSPSPSDSNSNSSSSSSLPQPAVAKPHHSSLASAISAYDAEVQPRGRKAVLSSLENSLMLHDWAMITQSATFTRGMSKDQH